MRSGYQCSDDRLHGQPNAGAIKPPRGQNQAHVMPGAAHHRMQRNAQRDLERVAASRPSIFMCPIAGSMALRRLIMAFSVLVTPCRGDPGALFLPVPDKVGAFTF